MTCGKCRSPYWDIPKKQGEREIIIPDNYKVLSPIASSPVAELAPNATCGSCKKKYWSPPEKKKDEPWCYLCYIEPDPATGEVAICPYANDGTRYTGGRKAEADQ